MHGHFPSVNCTLRLFDIGIDKKFRLLKVVSASLKKLFFDFKHIIERLFVYHTDSILIIDGDIIIHKDYLVFTARILLGLLLT